MTCIAGIVDKGRVFIGGDSAGVGDYDLVVRADRKVFAIGDYVMGFTTSFRMGQLLAHAFAPPNPPSDSEDLMRFMVVDFIDVVRKLLKDNGFSKVEDNVESGGTFLVGVKGRLFHIADDFQVGESTHGFDACGCGAQLALGSLWAMQTRNLHPIEKVRAALAAAETFSAGVRAPFHIIGTE